MTINAAKIMEGVQLNQRLLSGCDVPHRFDIELNPGKKLGGRWKCAKCGGVIDKIAKIWYTRGLSDAKRRV